MVVTRTQSSIVVAVELVTWHRIHRRLVAHNDMIPLSSTTRVLRIRLRTSKPPTTYLGRIRKNLFGSISLPKVDEFHVLLVILGLVNAGRSVIRICHAVYTFSFE